MSAKNTVEVLIGGKIIHLTGYESEDYLQRVASYLNRKHGEISELTGFSRLPAETKSLLLSLNVCDDYFKAKKQAEVYEEDIQIKDREVYELKQQIVDLQLKLEKLEKGRSAK
ncbi:MAG: cell division protein ZapA [Lachnospiraceae bacterium]|nr:cell division protein ZapA [Candidatus Equihabitans merdae]